MALQGEYLGMPVSIPELDRENTAFYKYCGARQLHLQSCTECGLKRYPPNTACPWCANEGAEWLPVEGKGTVHSYGEVHHAIQPAFRQFTPYLILLVELDEQKGQPTEHDGIRFNGNLSTPDGEMAPPDVVKQVGIGTRVRVVFKDIGEDIAIPLWTIDEEADQPETPWRYAIE
ncbi:MAG: OB-fold domain-containing protein [Gammaproteobacteria bacterium]|nr:OB-fold domain-containing protein [Gammaproteobacteria bacterium]